MKRFFCLIQSSFATGFGYFITQSPTRHFIPQAKGAIRPLAQRMGALAVTWGLLLTSLHAIGEEFQITDIQLEGLQRVSPAPVFAALPIEAGDYADRESIAATMRSLFDTGFFTDIKILREGNVMIVRVFERPAISAVNLDGNKAIKSEQLEEVMNDNGLTQGEILKRQVLDGLVRELERQYVAQGRYSAAVETEIVAKPNNQVEVNINIDEGKVAGIRHINIIGNEKFKEKELIELFESKEAGWLSWLTSNNRYAKERLKGDIEKLESFYLDRGYLDFEVVSSQVSLSSDKKNIFVTLNISEGDVYTVTEIDVAGDTILPESTIRRLILLREGQTFAQNLMTATSEYINSLLGNAGYTNANVEGIPEPNSEDKTVKVTFFVDPKKRVYVRRILFSGNARTSDEVLRREMRQMESAAASNSRIERGKVRLERLGYFKDVAVENIPVPGAEDTVDVQYKVEEQHSDSISASVGYSQNIGATIGANLQINNWLGTGKRVGINLNHNRLQTAYGFSYTDPYFTPDGVSRGISLYYQERDTRVIRSQSSYGTNRYGVDLTFGYPVTEVQRLNFGVGYNHLEIITGGFTAPEIRSNFRQFDLNERPYLYVNEDDIPTVAELLENSLLEDFSLPVQFVRDEHLVTDIEPGFINRHGDTFDTFTGNVSWVRNTLNRGILATRGNSQSARLEFSAPGSDLEYFRIELAGEFYKPLTKHFTLKLKGNVGYGDGFGDIDRLPFFESFYAGGFGSVRGFERSSLGPRQSPQVQYQDTNIQYAGVDSNSDGVLDVFNGSGSGYVLCNQDRQTLLSSGRRLVCSENQLQLNADQVFQTRRSIGGNFLVEMSSEILFPLPFLKDQRSVQTGIFVDAGNVFDSSCGRFQTNCFGFDWSKLAASYGIGMTWISPMGPLTFSLSKPFQASDIELSEREAFQFSFGSGF